MYIFHLTQFANSVLYNVKITFSKPVLFLSVSSQPLLHTKLYLHLGQEGRATGKQPGATRETQKGARLSGGLANIEKNKLFCEILNKMPQKGGGRRTVPPPCTSM